MFRFLKTFRRLKGFKIFDIGTRYHIEPDGTKVPATFKINLFHMRFHIFYRADDKDYHTHPWEFWTFPFVSYMEEILVEGNDGEWEPRTVVVPSWRWTYKAPDVPHRVMGPARKGKLVPFGKIVTMLWRGGCTGHAFFYIEQNPHTSVSRFKAIPSSYYIKHQYDADFDQQVNRLRK